jgi:uroporphyrinogen decarboxylase
MTSRERILAAINHEEADRVAIHDGPWATTVRRWREEGLPEGQSPAEHFGFEFRTFSGDSSLRLDTEVIEETDEYNVVTTGDGATRKNWRNATSTPELIDFSITTRRKWEEVRPRMEMCDERVSWEDGLRANRAATDQSFFRVWTCGPGFTRVCNRVGPERLLIAMVEEPEWAKDMFMTDARLCAAIAEEMMTRGFVFDAGWVMDDLGYKHRGFFSPAQYRDLLMPAHRLICDVLKARGLPMLLHSCGYVTEFIPDFIECGFDVIQPLEVKAGNDMLALKREFGDTVAFMGGIDVRAMADPDPSVIEREIAAKLPVMKQGGGYIYHSDHSVPDNVSFEQYQRVMELVAEHGQY